MSPDRSKASIVAASRSLHLPVTAEGVESEEVRARLQSLGCADGQGWLWGKAVPAAAVRTLLASRVPVELLEVVKAVLPPAAGERRDEERRPSKSKKRAL